jgi:hypothetical protein
MKRYDEALTFVELLGWNEQRTHVMQLFDEDDPQYMLKVCLQAAREALLQGSLIKAKTHFRAVFEEAVAVYNDATSGSEDTSDAGSSFSGHFMDDLISDVLVIHEPDSPEWRDKAMVMADSLQEACDLRMSVLDRDLPLCRLKLESPLRMMRRSSLVVVLAGHRSVSKELRYIIHNAVTRPSTVVLLADGDHVPEMLKKTHRSMQCPQQLLVAKSNPDSSAMDPTLVDCIIQVFSFLVNIPVTPA